ncbi:hypothetical protein MtrunA17_Chr8g0345611 [Medicago truncatula]|uniref:Uncharacterized protein n=1 Tax=Medicago truncatula TaxID=3880 RepID=A0A396GJ41_MEDTR|nr:hypothetical protein MtrunA17_Chr8g0345611 [Medicago truncatula]
MRYRFAVRDMRRILIILAIKRVPRDQTTQDHLHNRWNNNTLLLISCSHTTLDQNQDIMVCNQDLKNTVIANK